MPSIAASRNRSASPPSTKSLRSAASADDEILAAEVTTYDEPGAKSGRAAAGWRFNLASLRRRLANCPPVFTPLVLLLAATVLLCASNWDTGISGLFYEAGGKWPLGDTQPWKAMYDYGELPALVLGIGGLVVAIGALVLPQLRSGRKAGLFLALALMLGPGLIVNGLLKPHWGRPRPSQTAMFGGSSAYAPVWVPGTQSAGRSFPSGHASMGFFLMVPGFLLYRKNRRLAVLLFAGGLAAGGVVGLARIVQGRHYASDVLWSAACVYYSALFLSVLFRLDVARARRSQTTADSSDVFRLPEQAAADGYREAA